MQHPMSSEPIAWSPAVLLRVLLSLPLGLALGWIVTYVVAGVFWLNDWTTRLYWSASMTRIMPWFWRAIDWIWQKLFVGLGFTLIACVVCGACFSYPARVLVEKVCRNIRERAFFTGLAGALALAGFTALMVAGYVSSGEVFHRFRADSGLRKGFVVILVVLGALAVGSESEDTRWPRKRRGNQATP